MTESASATTTGTDPNTHVTVNAVLCYIGGGLMVFLGLIAFIATMAAGSFVDEFDSSGAAGYWTRFGGMIALMFMLVMGLPAIFAGIGLNKRAEWGRILALVVASFNLLIGLTLLGGNVTAIINLGWGGYAFWSLLQPDVAALFREDAGAATA